MSLLTNQNTIRIGSLSTWGSGWYETNKLYRVLILQDIFVQAYINGIYMGLHIPTNNATLREIGNNNLLLLIKAHIFEHTTTYANQFTKKSGIVMRLITKYIAKMECLFNTINRNYHLGFKSNIIKSYFLKHQYTDINNHIVYRAKKRHRNFVSGKLFNNIKYKKCIIRAYLINSHLNEIKKLPIINKYMDTKLIEKKKMKINKMKINKIVRINEHMKKRVAKNKKFASFLKRINRKDCDLVNKCIRLKVRKLVRHNKNKFFNHRFSNYKLMNKSALKSQSTVGIALNRINVSSKLNKFDLPNNKSSLIDSNKTDLNKTDSNKTNLNKANWWISKSTLNKDKNTLNKLNKKNLFEKKFVNE